MPVTAYADVPELATPHGPARAHIHPADGAVAAVVLGHGAGGGGGAPDLLAAAGAALDAGWSVALVEQPYRVAGRRSAAPAPQLDAAWTAVVAQLRDGPLAGRPVVCGGRSSGARVACRTAAASGATGVVCRGFRRVPAPRRGGACAGRGGAAPGGAGRPRPCFPAVPAAPPGREGPAEDAPGRARRGRRP